MDGNPYVDYLLGLGPMILGHRHPVVTKAVTRAITEFGTCPGRPYELEMEAAAKEVDAVPGAEMVRFSNTTWTRFAAGPAESPRPVAAGPGVPLELADTLIVLTWNDPDSFRMVLAAEAS